MKPISVLSSTLFLIIAFSLVLTTQALADGYQQPYNGFQAGMNGNLAVPYQPIFDRPLGYYPETPNYRSYMPQQPTALHPKATPTWQANRQRAINACNEIQGNPAAQRTCFMGIP